MQPVDGGNRYRFLFRGESWWDVVSVRTGPRISLASIAARLNRLEETPQWWASPDDWTVPELGFGEPVTFPLLAVRFDPQMQNDPVSSLATDVVVRELRKAFETEPPVVPSAFSS